MKTNKRRHASVPVMIWRNSSVRWRMVWAAAAALIGMNIWMVSLSTYYWAKHRNQPIEVGATFISDYARHYGLIPEETLAATLGDLKVDHVRLVSYWKNHEKSPGVYDFTDLDWQFDMALRFGAKVSLSVGLRQPRWPECHLPQWADDLPKPEWYQALYDYMSQVVNRYKTHPALESYQLENEYFLEVFGECDDFSRERLVTEFDLVKSIDPDHPIIISRSNNLWGWPVGEPQSDMYSMSVYKRVYDKTVTRRYFEYPFPPAFYGSLAALSDISQGKEVIIHELQTEPWGKKDVRDMTIAEQDVTMDAQKLSERIDFAVASGTRRFDVWGVEWWYYRMRTLGDPSVWETGRAKLREVKANQVRPQTLKLQ